MKIRAWWNQFRARHIVSDDPWELLPPPTVQPAVEPRVQMWIGGVVAHRAPPAVTPRIIPMACRRPNGQWVKGWRVFAHNDAERAEVLWAAWVLGQRVSA
jgi:hypothetical protein